MKLLLKHFTKCICINFKIYFIIFLSILLYLEIFKNIIIINQNKEKNNYFQERKNKENNFFNSYNEQYKKKTGKKRIGIIGLMHHKNVGNNLLKFAIYIQLKELGVEPYIVGKHKVSQDIRFLNRTTHPRIIQNFNEIKENDYDILMVNSDQTWKYSYFYEIGLLNFSKNWKVPKFIYGASNGVDYWAFSKETDKIAKILLKNFSGISFREMSTVKYAKEHLGIDSTFVLDPTMLIDKKYYIEIVKNYKNINIPSNLREYILIYKLDKMKNMETFIRRVQSQLKYKIFNIKLNDNDYIERFLYGIFHCKAVITNSYHATIFSIIFNKPFIVFLNSARGNGRFKTIKEVYGIKDRFFSLLQKPNMSLLTTPLKVNYTSINLYRNISLEYLKKNLNII